MQSDSLVARSIKKVIKNNIGLDLLLIFVVCGVVITSLVPPQILKYIIDHNLVPKSSEHLIGLAVAYLGVVFLIGGFEFIKEALLTIMGQKITREIRVGMMIKLEKIDASFFTANDSGAIVSRFLNDVDAINSLFTSGVVGMMVDCFKIIGIIISIWLFSTALGIITLVLLPIIYLITRLIQKNMFNAQIDNRVLVGRVNTLIAESLKNIKMIKSFSKEAYMEQNYTARLSDSYLNMEKVNFYDAVYSPIILVIRAVVITSIVILSSQQLNFLGITLGMVAASIDLITNLFTPVENLGMELQNIQQAASGIQRVNDFYHMPEDDPKKRALKAAEIVPNGADVRLALNDVTFAYQEGTDVLQNINLLINPMEKVTFVGRTGVGKSTLFKLIMGLLKPTSGSITLNGFDVYEIPNSEKRRLFGYVDQSFPIIRGTIADQIGLHDNNISREQIASALDFVGLTDYVNSLADGINTQINSDTFFSQGQRQLLAIARAVVTNPPILLLDEITANLDSLTEEKIISVLHKASRAHMILSISHRLSSVTSDKVVILENGRIKNTGSPEVLLQTDDWYRSHLALERLTWS